jgi:hypothetical protein
MGGSGSNAYAGAALITVKTPLVLQGSVNEIRVANPHMRLVLHLSDNTVPGISSPRATASITSIDRAGAWAW